MNIQTPLKLTALICASVLIAACGGGGGGDNNPDPDPDPDPTPDPVSKDFTIDASAGGRLEAKNNPYVYIDLAKGKVVSGLNDDNADSAANKDKWQIAMKRTKAVKLNGGVSGAGSTSGALAVESDMYVNGKISDSYANLTADSEVGKFNNFTLAQAKALTYAEDANGLFIDQTAWGVYNPSNHTIEMSNKWWIVEGGNGSFVKMRVKEYNSPNITIEYYFAKDKDTDYPITNPKTYTTSLSGDGSECIDFDTGTAIAACDLDNAASGEWDLIWEKNSTTRARGLWTNGGIVGTGSGGALGPKQYLTAAEDPNAGVRGKASNFGAYAKGAFFDNGAAAIEVGTTGDSTGGIFSAEENGAAKYGWGEYSLADNHKLWPNFRVWAIRTGKDEASYKYYKVQILSYYNEAGESGHFKIKREELK